MDQTIGYFLPDLSDLQKNKLTQLGDLYREWNSRINVISRKDIDNFLVRHIVHSLSIAKVFSFSPATRILDVGTGGGFPGIPLAIMFPDTTFTLLDSTRKKIRVVEEIASSAGLSNVKAVWKRVEEETAKYDFIVSRAVTTFEEIVRITLKNIDTTSASKGIITLKGGDLTSELGKYRNRVKIWNIRDFFDDDFFETKKIVYLPL